jgi:hypothetical protein
MTAKIEGNELVIRIAYAPPPVDIGDAVVYSYTRAQAIADGVLIDVSAQAHRVGWIRTWNVAITEAVYDAINTIPGHISQDLGPARLDHILITARYILRAAWMKSATGSTEYLPFPVDMPTAKFGRIYKAYLHVPDEDKSCPIATILQFDED